jgi:hypothetical protein
MLLAATSLALAACGGSGEETRQLVVDGSADDSVNAAIELLLGAAITGDEAALSRLVDPSCGNEGDLIAAAARLSDLLPPGTLEVQAPRVEVRTLSEDRVEVTGLPDLTLLIDGEPLPSNVAVGLANPRLRLTRADGGWRLEGCGEARE